MSEFDVPRASQPATELAWRLLGLGPTAPAADAAAWQRALIDIWQLMFRRLPGALADDLAALDLLFNPTRKGETLREALGTVAATPADLAPALSGAPAQLFLRVSDDKYLVTPEGRIALTCLASDAASPTDDIVILDQESAEVGLSLLWDHYQRLSRSRLRDVAELLAGESKQTLRPAVSGLLLVLLLNRNDVAERSLTRFRGDRNAAQSLTEALTLVTSAYTQALGFGADTRRAVDVYRGWAYGELSRHLGPAVHVDDEALWLTDTDAALRRLVKDIEQRPPDVRRLVPAAVEATRLAYAGQRSTMSVLGVCYERPSYSDRTFAAVTAAARR